MNNKKIFICEDSIEGIFTAIFDAWSSRYGHDNIRIDVEQIDHAGMTMELFAEYIVVEADDEKTRKVAKSIQEKISEEAYNMVCNAACSDTEGKADGIYRFLILGFHMGSRVVDHLSNDVVMNMFNMSRKVGNETHHFLGFLRFAENKNNILFSKINPKNDILRLIAPHFSDRLQQENFIIYDEKRKTAVVHRSGYPWIYTMADYLKIDHFNDISLKEEEFQLLWTTFFNTIAIQERKNDKLQRNLLPLRFRSNMPEFQKMNNTKRYI